MRTFRIAIALVGIALPYAARIPRGAAWLEISFMFRRRATLLIPCVAGFGFLAWARFILDLASDAQAAIALIFIPLYAVVPIAAGTAIGYVLDRRMRRRDADPTSKEA